MCTVSIIIVNHKTPEMVRDCIGSLAAHINVPHEIIVVEASPDLPVTIDGEAPTAKFVHIPTTRRRGFGEANNLGAAQAHGRYLWLLNSDTLIPNGRVNDLFPMMERHPELGLVTPVLFSDPALCRRQPDFHAYFQRFGTLLTRHLREPIDWSSPELPELISSQQITAASMIIRTELFRQLGGFDEGYFMYMEDDDLCYRAHQAGAEVAIATQVAVVHLQGQSISRPRERKRYYYASQERFWQTHYGWWPALLMRMLRLPHRIIKG